MTSHDDEKLDFRKLQRELDNAVEQDAKYWRENDAKIRAVTEQKVATYEEFKDLVAASHLKPLSRDDHIEKISQFSKHPWNPVAHSYSNSKTTPQPCLPKDEVKVPRTSQEFARDWQHRVKNVQERHDYLLVCGAPLLAELFQMDIGFGLLGDIITALSVFKPENARVVLDILSVLKNSQRFVLSLKFLSKNDIESCEQLFKRLEEIERDKEYEEILKVLRSVYLPL